MRSLSSMNIMADRAKTLKILKLNRAKHRKVVEEARKGYLDKAQEVLAARLKDLRSGKIVHLNFTIAPPQDYTSVYDTAIKMLEMHTEKKIGLDSDQVRHIVMDEWDWQRQFLSSNSAYSGTAREEFRKYAPSDD